MKIIPNYPLSTETTFLCGGRAKWFVAPSDFSELKNILKFHKGRLYILGGGSKTLCVDSGFDGLVVSTKHLNQIKFDGDLVQCDCGVRFDSLHTFCQQNGLSGLEWSAGIPASVGGATVMNAGAFGHEFSNCVEKVEVLKNQEVMVLGKNQLSFSYRSSSLKGFVVLRVWLKLQPSSRESVQKDYAKFLAKKTTAQPTHFGSVGSVFKRQKDVIPAKIIDKLGLKGVKIGGAEISQHHGGFIVNTGSATATDVLKLIDFVKETVLEKCGITLQNEIIVLE